MTMPRSSVPAPRLLVLAVIAWGPFAVAPLRAQSGTTAARSADPGLSTFSIVACDAARGFLGVAIQSRVVGAGSIVPAAEAGVGAIATQAAANVAFKERGLDLLRDGRSPEEVAAAFRAEDPGSAHRQFAVADADCRVSAFTGDSTLAWAGHRTGAGYSVQGNILAGPAVVDSMAAAYERSSAEGLPFGERLLAALEAGQAAGGDRRGQQGAGLLIVKAEGGYGGGDDRYADLRVEDHVAPIAELRRVYDVWMAAFHPEDHFVPGGSRSLAVPAGPHVCSIQALLAGAGFGEAPAADARFCAFDETVIAPLKAFQQAHGLRVAPAVTVETAVKLREISGGTP